MSAASSEFDRGLLELLLDADEEAPAALAELEADEEALSEAAEVGADEGVLAAPADPDPFWGADVLLEPAPLVAGCLEKA